MMNRLIQYLDRWLSFRYAALVLALLFITPVIIWALLDQGLWKGDPVGYAYKIVCQYQDMTSNFGYWILSQFVGYKGPFILWVGQFLVPFGKLIGHVNFALLLLPISAAFLSIFLMFRIIEHVFSDRLLALFGSLLMAGSPLFFGLATGFWIEPLQVAVIVALLYALLQHEHHGFWRTGSLFLIIGCLSILIKVAMPMYIVSPAIWYLVKMFKRPLNFGVQKKDYWLIAFATILLIPTLVFYLYNLKSLLEFAFFAASSPLFVGSNTQEKLLLGGFSNGVFLWFAFIWFLVLIGWGILHAIKFGWQNSSKMLLGISAFQVALFIFLWLNASNGDSRYFLPVLPYIVILICWSIKQISRKTILSLSYLLASIQYFIIVSYSYGIVNLNPAYGMIRPLERAQSPDMETVQFIIGLVGEGKRFVVDFEPEISLAELQFELSKKNLDTDWRYFGSEVSNFFNYHNQQIDTSQIQIENALSRILTYKPDYYLTWQSRLKPEMILLENQRIDAYNAYTIPYRWEIAERLSLLTMPDLHHVSKNYNLLIFRLNELPK